LELACRTIKSIEVFGVLRASAEAKAALANRMARPENVSGPGIPVRSPTAHASRLRDA
jgi:hypothetical protein